MKISIITTTRNNGKTIEDTLKSVLRQSYANIEHIVKDAVSEDDTPAICREYQQKYYTPDNGRGIRTMKFISGKDDGIYDGMNQGVRAATGDVVGILNADDFFTSDDVLEFVAGEFAAHPELEAVYGDIHFVAAGATLSEPGRCTRYYSSAMFSPWLLRFGFMPAHPGFYVRREVYERYGLYDTAFRTSSDFEWIVRLFGPRRIRAKYIRKDIVTMRMGGETTRDMAAKRKVNDDVVRALKKHGIFTCDLFKYVRYAYKYAEILIGKIFH